jgi:hypothetical protein
LKIIGNNGGHKEERLESKRWRIAIAAVVMQLSLVTGLAVMGFGFGVFFMG